MKFKFAIFSFFIFLSSLLPIDSQFIQASAIYPIESSYEQTSPTSLFLKYHPYHKIEPQLKKYYLTEKDKKLFNQLIKNEKNGFIGYHASSTEFAAFQDIIRCVIEEKMKLKVPKNFHFFRNPLDDNLIYESAADFNQAISIPEMGYDDNPLIRQHILSLNVALYQSYNMPWDLTPRYYLENQTWTTPKYQSILEDFFNEVGLDPKSVAGIYSQAKTYLSDENFSYLSSDERGVIFQFFIKDADYEAINTYFYTSWGGGAFIPGLSATDVLFDYYDPSYYPQLRMIFNINSTLNPYHKIIMRRFDNLTNKQRSNYENSLRSEIKKLAIDSYKLLEAKNKLLQAWEQN